MERTKKFEISDLECLQALVGKKMKDIFYQPVAGMLSDGNMFVVNFGDKKTEYSLNVFCFMRVRESGEILLNSSDEYFGEYFEKLTAHEHEESCKKQFKGALISKNILLVKERTKFAKIKSITVSEVADIIIEFDNKIIMEVTPDCLFNHYEYYRFFNTKGESPHFVVTFSEGKIVISY